MTTEPAQPGYDPLLWSDALPWLTSVEPDRWWAGALPPGHAPQRRRLSERAARLAVEHLPRWTVAQVAPWLPVAGPDLLLSLSPKASNTLRREGRETLVTLATTRVSAMLAWAQTGPTTVVEILGAAIDISLDHALAVTTEGSSGRGEALSGSGMNGAPTEMTVPDQWSRDHLTDVETVAAWATGTGREHAPLSEILRGAYLPAGVRDAATRIKALTAHDVLPKAAGIADLLDTSFRALDDERLVLVLAERVFADDPLTLDALGKKMGVTRERVRQLETKARDTLLAGIGDGTVLGQVAATVRAVVDKVVPLPELLDALPGLREIVPSLGLPAWRVLDPLDGAYEIRDGWCATRSVAAAVRDTKELAATRVDDYGTAKLETLTTGSFLDTGAPWLDAWLLHCGIETLDRHILTQVASKNARAASVLAVTGRPMTSEEIGNRFPTSPHSRSFKNALAADRRLVRVGKDRWALESWGLRPYASIRDLIRGEIDDHGGRAALADMVERFPELYDVSPSSVIAYASIAPFALRDGMVSISENLDPPSRAPARTRRMFRWDSGWAWRTTITHDHVRGSGSSAPTAVAGLLGLSFGDRTTLRSPVGDQLATYVGTQPAFGTVRRLVEHHGLAEGDEVFMLITDDGTFDITRVAPAAPDPLGGALRLAGLNPTRTLPEAARALAAAIELDQSTPLDEVISTYDERGDDDVAQLLRLAVSPHPS